MAQLIGGTLLLAAQQERLLFMDVFGKPFEVYLALAAGPARADKIASTLASMTATETMIQAYAATNGHDLTADLAAGSAAIAAAVAAQATSNPTPTTPAPTTPAPAPGTA